LDKALTALQPLAAARGGKLVCVFGCGGNRDRAKRPLMGAIAAAKADKAIITSDNPRDEDPAQILADIAAGAGTAAVTLVDRKAAIQAAVLEAGPRDVLLVAGKGHEDYQEIKGRRWPFSDVDEARLALITRAGL
jgi:UDP-N-acetylmuramoyl-L-alanyl-D-glutamate--2,6-diaminopimelate ligase